MRLKITHKDGYTTVSDLDTGKPIGGVKSVSFDRYEDTPATVSLTLIDTTGYDFEVDAEVRLPSKEAQ